MAKKRKNEEKNASKIVELKKLLKDITCYHCDVVIKEEEIEIIREQTDHKIIWNKKDSSFKNTFGIFDKDELPEISQLCSNLS